jgi:hypothetical protein
MDSMVRLVAAIEDDSCSRSICVEEGFNDILGEMIVVKWSAGENGEVPVVEIIFLPGAFLSGDLQR